jgi:hypothetical protein
LFDPGLVSLQRPTFRLLAAEPELVQQASGVTAMVLNVTALMNQRRHAARGPQLRGKAVGHRAFQQSFDDALSLRFTQRWWSTWRRTNLQGVITATAACIPPAHHRAGSAVRHATDLTQRVALIQQSQRLPTPCLDQFRRSPGSRHASAPLRQEQLLLHYLRDSQ